MVLVNLLPWRVQAERYRRDSFRQLIIVAVMSAVLILFALHLCLQSWVKSLDDRLVLLRRQLNQAEMRHQKASITVMRQNDVLVLDAGADQFDLQAFIQKMTDAQSSDICFTEISRNQNKIRFTGKVSSAEKLAVFFTLWPAAVYFNQIRINRMKPDDEGLLTVEFEGIERRGYAQHN